MPEGRKMKVDSTLLGVLCEYMQGDVYRVDTVCTDDTIHTKQLQPEQDKWVGELLQEFDGYDKIDDLMEAGNIYFECRYAAPVLKRTIGAFKQRAKDLVQAPSKVVVVDNSKSQSDSLSRLQKIYADTKPKKFVVVSSPGCETTGYLRGKGIQVIETFSPENALASAAFRAKLLDQDCILVTDSSLCWQSLGSGVAIYLHDQGKYIGEAWLLENRRITPSQAVDWHCMVRHGIGEELVSDLLFQYGSFMGIWDARGGLPQEVRMSLADLLEVYLFAREIYTLRRNVPVSTW
jgi:hypothetical protein